MIFLKKIYTKIRYFLQLEENEPLEKNLLVKFGLIIFDICGVIIIFGSIFFIFPPFNFPNGTYLKIERGDTLNITAEKLANQNFIRSPLAFKILVKLVVGDRKLQAGSFYFPRPQSALNISFRIVGRDFGYAPYRVTVIEGMTCEQIANLLAKQIPGFNRDLFIAKTARVEGQLFPDTYFFSPLDSASDVAETMLGNFSDNIAKANLDIRKTGKSLNEILTMASIIEQEARTAKDRRIVSGILWKRLAAKMPLQVDAAFTYILAKNTFELTTKDLKMKSPYNTYLNKGLPPTPICNPSWDSIMAAINPEISPYWYYLSDRSGVIHYAKTFAGHKANRQSYGI